MTSPVPIDNWDTVVTWYALDSQESRSLRLAVKDDNPQTLLQLLAPDVDIDALHGNGTEGDALLHLAAGKGSISALCCLLDQGAYVDTLNRDRHGDRTALHFAAQAVCPEAVRVLLRAGADIHSKRADYGTALKSVLGNAYRIKEAHQETIEVFLDGGADINEPACEMGVGTVLQSAVGLGDVKLAQWLLDRGASIDGSLGYSVGRGHPEVTKWLIERGAKDVDASALALASAAGQLDLCQIVFPCAKQATPIQLGTALTCAARAFHIPVVSFLLSQGINPNQIDEFGQTALQVAQSTASHEAKFKPRRPPNSAPDTMKLLLESGARTVDPGGSTSVEPGQSSDQIA